MAESIRHTIAVSGDGQFALRMPQIGYVTSRIYLANARWSRPPPLSLLIFSLSCLSIYLSIYLSLHLCLSFFFPLPLPPLLRLSSYPSLSLPLPPSPSLLPSLRPSLPPNLPPLYLSPYLSSSPALSRSPFPPLSFAVSSRFLALSESHSLSLSPSKLIRIKQDAKHGGQR